VNLYALALVLNLLLGWPVLVGIVIAAAIVLVYITLGGLSSAIYNEVLQFFVILAALIPLTVVGLVDVGGWGGLQDAIRRSDLGEAGLHAWQGTSVEGVTNPIGTSWIPIVFGLGFVLSFGYWTTNFAEVQRAQPLSRAAHAADRGVPELCRRVRYAVDGSAVVRAMGAVGGLLAVARRPLVGIVNRGCRGRRGPHRWACSGLAPRGVGSGAQARVP
jgi:hypothetical protein